VLVKFANAYALELTTMTALTTAADPKKATVATPTKAYNLMAPLWRLMDTLLAGTDALRAAGQDYLPKHENESTDNYDNRLARAVLFNMTEQTLNSVAGKPFREELVFSEDTPPTILDLAEDIDMLGHDLQSFARSWFKDAWAKGLSHVLVEFPTAEPLVDEKGNPLVDANGDPVKPTLADDRAQGLRPFWIAIPPENIIAIYSEVRNGKEYYTHVRIVEKAIERDGWGERETIKVRVLEPGLWWLYVPPTKKDDPWVLEASGVSDFDEIPLVTFYASKREAPGVCKPPLLDLAHLNIAHWQSSSDQRNVLTVSRFPILAASGVAADQKVTIGPNNFLTTEDVQGKWYYVEHTGAAISAGAVDLASLEQQMAAYGAEFVKARPGNETATGRALDSAEATSYLGATVLSFKDSLEQALKYTAMGLKLPEAGSVSMDTDFDLDEGVQGPELDALAKARATRDISRVAYVTQLIERGVLPEDFDIEEDAALLEEESNAAMGNMFGPGVPGQVPPTQTPPTQTLPTKTPPIVDPENDPANGGS
jgi:hypothetical protein